MKNKIFKTLAVFGLSLLAWNCSEDLATAAQNGMEAITPQAKPALEVDQSSWMLVAGSQIFLIVPNGTGTYLVTNEASIPVDAFNVATGSIVDMSGNPVVNNINLATLPVVSPDKTITYPDGSKATITGQTLLLPGGIDPNSIGTGTGTNTVSSSSVYIPTQNPVASSSSAKNNQQQP